MLLSAWSAAASDVYISSRFLFFLARCRHAPQFLASLIRWPYTEPRPIESEDELSEEESDDDLPPVIQITRESATSLRLDDMEDRHDRAHADVSEPLLTSMSFDSPDTPELSHLSSTLSFTPHSDDLGSKDEVFHVEHVEAASLPQLSRTDLAVENDAGDMEQRVRKKVPLLVLPLYAVLASASVGLLSFLGSATGNTAETVSR